jgi:hypothetical protein
LLSAKTSTYDPKRTLAPFRNAGLSRYDALSEASEARRLE